MYLMSGIGICGDAAAESGCLLWRGLRRWLGRSALAKRTSADQRNCQEQASDFVHELASQSASMLIIRKYVGPAAAIYAGAIVFQILQKFGPATADAASLKKVDVREKQAAKIHQASKGSAHHHTSVAGGLMALFCRCLEAIYASCGCRDANVSAVCESKVNVKVFS